MSGAGFGNKTNAEPEFDGHDTKYNSITEGSYQGATNYGSGATGGAGFGNKSNTDPGFDLGSDTRLGLSKSTDAYQGATGMGSGSTAGAGYGNKTSNHEATHDSTLGKIMEKVGNAVGHHGMVEKGKVRRDSASKETPYTAN